MQITDSTMSPTVLSVALRTGVSVLASSTKVDNVVKIVGRSTGVAVVASLPAVGT